MRMQHGKTERKIATQTEVRRKTFALARKVPRDHALEELPRPRPEADTEKFVCSDKEEGKAALVDGGKAASFPLGACFAKQVETEPAK
jgi:hypothetical protein